LDTAGPDPIPPTQLPDFAEDIKLLNMVENYAAKKQLKELSNVAVGVKFGIVQYMKLAVEKWNVDELKGHAESDTAQAYQQAYLAALTVIRATEMADMASFNKRAAVAAEQSRAVEPPSALDEIADFGEMLHRAYEQAMTLKSRC
jgi:hypothetical protein